MAAHVLTAASDESLTLRTSWLVVGRTLAFGFSLAIPILLVRRLPQHEFGLYKQAFLIINSAVTLLPLGFGMTAFYFLPREERYRRHAVFNVVFFTTAVATLFGVLLSLFPTTLILLFKEPAAVAFAPWIAAVVVLSVVGSFLEIVTIANQEVRLATLVILGVQITRATLFLVAAVAAGTVRAVLFAAVLQGVVQVAVLLRYLSSRFPGFWRAVDFAFLRRQLAYAIPFGVAGFLYSLQIDLHNYFVSHDFGATAYAIYSVGCFQLPLLGILMESIGGVLIPRISLLQRDGETREIVLLTARAMRKLALVYLPAYVFLLVVRREFIVALFTDRYLASVPLFAVNLTLIPLAIFFSDPIMRAFAEHRVYLIKLHAGIVVGLTATLPFAIARFGLMGSIVTVVVFSAIGRAAALLKIATILHVERRDVRLFKDLAKTAGAAAVAGGLTALARPLMAGVPPLMALAACGAWFGLTYTAAVFASGIVTVEERAFLMNYVRRLTGRWPQPIEGTVVPAGE
jgi:O-antigen/teichoic acid export membrane protein